MCSPALGDTLLFSAVLQDVRARFPKAEIIHVCMKQNLAAAELLPGVDRRLLVNLTEPFDTIRRIREQKLDVLLDFSAWQRLTAFYSLTSGARFTAGFQTEGQYRGLAYDITSEHRRDRHELENFRSLVKAVGIPSGSAITLAVPELSEEPLAEARNPVVFHLWAGTQSSLREWPEDRWIALAKAMATPETVFAITGGPGDREQADRFHLRMKEAGLRSSPFIGANGFVSLAHLLRRARVVVSVNTGVMHLAAALGAPTVSINGPTRNERWGPIGERVEGVSASGPGCGFLHLGFEFDGQRTDCMERTTVDMVLAAVRRVEARQVAGRNVPHVDDAMAQRH
jgi:ADP-heptose:LPS heptosyltransferase